MIFNRYLKKTILPKIISSRLFKYHNIESFLYEKNLKNFFKETIFFSLGPIFIIKRIIKIEKNKRKYLKAGLNIFKFKKLDFLANKLKKKSEVVILGCGETVDELTQNDFELLKTKITIGISRWFYQEFVPDILIAEFSCIDKNYNDDRWLNHFLEGINSRSNEYKNTLLLIEVFDKSFKLQNEIINRISPQLKENIFFISSFCSFNFKNFPLYFSNNRIFLNILQKLDILWHSRALVFYGASIALYLKAKNLILIGVDGYEGYFKLFNKFDKKYIVNKNFSQNLHSSANPKFGFPTITDSFFQISNLINVKTTSINTIISEYVPVVNLD